MTSHSKGFSHIPVLLDEVIDNLNIKPDGIYVDGTLGGAGHSSKICERLENGRLIGIDQDIDAINAAKERLYKYKDKIRIDIINDNFINIPYILENLGIERVDGILLDIGVSSYQIDEPSRGFSYMADAPLDMRMCRDNSLNAREIVNNYKESELLKILKEYGEEKNAKQIVRQIVKRREKNPIETTGELSKIVETAVPSKYSKNGNPAKKTFQALRIAVNDELFVLEATLGKAIDYLNDGGRLCVISFHSLEDRITKKAFRKAEDPCTCPKSFPVCVCGKVSAGKVVTRSPILPSKREALENSRAKSAKLRVFERVFAND